MNQTLGAICGSVALWLFLISPVVAQPACPPDALGVSRTIEVDTHGGPRFGEPSGDPDFLAHGEVVLTFDDGPMPKYTRPILAALKAQCTKATFFSVGEMAVEYPDVLKEVATEGHTVASHTWSHKNLARLSADKLRLEIETGLSAVNQAVGAAPAPFFRFPYLSESRAAIDYLESRNIAMFAVDIDSLDWRTHDPRRVVQRVMGGLERRGRGIILFHDIHSSTVGALPEILAQLKARRFKVVHLQSSAPIQTLSEYQVPAKRSGAPIAAAKRLKNGTLKTYKGFPHGMPTTEADTINADLLAFIRG
jgi:peptidoglycan-N-acetylglucosamine deacetylase